MNSLIWKFNRLRTMGPTEMLWRGKKALQNTLEHQRRGFIHRPPQADKSCGQKWVTPLPTGFDRKPYLRAADQILMGRFDVFALHAIPLGFPPKWNQDPKTGTNAPLEFGKNLAYRDENIVGDIKYLWEINRHYEVVTLAQAFYLSGQDHYAAACRLLLESWFDQCRYPFGQAWSSSLENAIRLVNWAVSWHLLDAGHTRIFENSEGIIFKRRWLDSINQHCQFIARHFSLYSSANNHLFGEYMGLFIGAITWPCWDESAEWLDLAKDGLEREALTQNASDGVNREQAIWYQHEVADMMLLAGLFGKANGIQFSESYWKRLEVMLEFIRSVMDVAGNVPMIGDADDALMVRFSQEPSFDAYRSLLATGAVLFGRADFKEKAGAGDDKSRWLLGDSSADAFALLHCTEKREPTRVFPEGGYYILGHDFDTESELKLVADAGPLGYLSIAAHGHADALAFTLSAGGRELLIDTGTYAYHTQKKWRDYFRGTSAHNTVRVDGLDQSESGGNFMWLRKANANCQFWHSSTDQDSFTGRHDGYRRLPDPVIHTRTIVVDKRENTILVEDILECRAAHQIEFFWHFSNSCNVIVAQDKVLAVSGNVRMEMGMLNGDGKPVLVTGSIDPPLGWVSDRYDQKLVSPSIVWKEKITGTVRRTTLLRVDTGTDCQQLHRNE